MLLARNDLALVRDTLAKSAGWDQELLEKITPLVDADRYDAALREAFIVLEERLRKATDKEAARMTGVQLANAAFGGSSPSLGMHLGSNHSEREGLHALYEGAFKLYRNPGAHRTIVRDDTEAKFVLSFVNLLLLTLQKVASANPPTTFPDNLQSLLVEYEKAEGAESVRRLRVFLQKCIGLGLTPRSKTKKWIGFRRHARTKYPHWDHPKAHPVTLFYFYIDGEMRGLWFPVRQYYSNVVGFDTKLVASELRGLGFAPSGKAEDYSRRLNRDTGQDFFERLFEVVKRTVDTFEATM